MLAEIARGYKEKGDTFREKSYRKASQIVKAHPVEITSGNDVLKIKGVGKSIATSIEVYLQTGKGDRIDNSDESKVKSLFQTVYGVGPVKAKSLYDEGHRTLSDLQQAKLTKSQKLGLQHYKDINTPIPRKIIDMYKIGRAHV